MIYTFTGPNAFALQEALRNLIQAFIVEHGEFGIERLDAPQLSAQELQESIQAVPFLAGKRLLIIQDPADNKQFAEKFPRITDTISDDTDIVFIQPTFDKRSSFYKFLKQKTECTSFEELHESALLRWIQEYVTTQKGSISSADARFLVTRAGTAQRTLYSELNKLLSYSPSITKQSIELLIAPTTQSTIFDLIDAAFAGKTSKAFDLYKEQRLQKVEPLQIVAMIVWQLHIVAIVKTGGSKTSESIAREAKLNPYVVRKTSILADKMSLKQIKTLVTRTRVLERRLKRESIDGDEALYELLMQFTLS